MSNNYFEFKQFRIEQHRSAMKVSTDSVLLGAWVNCDGADTILDIGTGTGLLSLMLAQRTVARIDAIDIEEGAIEDARANARRSPWREKISISKADFRTFAHSHPAHYDLLISNPPYFEHSLKTSCEKKNMARHTDTLTYEELLRGAQEALTERGKLSVILPWEKKAIIIDLAGKEGLYYQKGTNIKPTPHKNFNRVMMQFGREHRRCATEDTLQIRDEKGLYTFEYRELTKDYYKDRPVPSLS